MEKKEKAVDDFTAKLLKEPLVKKYCELPIQIWQRDITLKWKCDKNIFNKFIQRIVAENSAIIKAGGFRKSDGSCASEITFFFQESVV